ncbi:LLM class flavin-dependent oxidoreductase [Streptomyces sp. IB2014 016-6]|nr:LLM class flavin-dependent oxidoreductase [Streptomyces sp. IB2014 016-6]
MGTDTIPWQLRTMLDPFVALSVATSVTERVLLGTSTLVAPWYSPLLLARSLTGVDVVSGGRLIPGLGTGWSPEEYQGVAFPGRSGARGWTSVWTCWKPCGPPSPSLDMRAGTTPSPPPTSGPSRSSALGPRSTCPASPRPPDAGRPAARTVYFPLRFPFRVPHSTLPP